MHRIYISVILILLAIIPANLKGFGFEENNILIGSRNNPFPRDAVYSGLIRSEEGLKLKPVSISERLSPLLYLDFENPVPKSLKDAAGNYSVRLADYNVTKDAWAGTQAALFSRSGNRILIHSPPELWPGRGILHESFTMEMQLKPVYFYTKNQIFSKTGIFDGIRKGLEIHIEENRVVVYFHNMIETPEGVYRSASLKSVTRLMTDQWYHIALRYDAEKSFIRLYINGREEDTYSLSFPNEKGLLSFHPYDRSPMIIGQSYVGILDEFAVHREPVGFSSDHKEGPVRSKYHPAYLDLQGFFPVQKRGSVLSAVTALNRSDRMTLNDVSYTADEPTGTKLDFYIRYSRNPFPADAPERNLPWIRVQGSEKNIRNAHYLQWKAELRSDPDGRSTPVLREIRIIQKTAERPDRPSGLRVIPELTGPDYLTIEWTESSDPDTESGGYYIYIGFRPGEAETRLKIPFSELKRILTPEEEKLSTDDPLLLKKRLHRKLRFRITNERIETETVMEGRFRRNHPFLRERAVHYITVSAYTENGGESEKSAEIAAEVPGR